jgi:hypothetical protein
MLQMRWLPILLTASLAQAAPLATFSSPSTGFIDDAFALRDDGRAIAYLITDGAEQVELHLAAIPSDKPETVLKNLHPGIVAVYWVSPSQVLLVTRQGEKATAQGYDEKGPTKLKLGPFDDIALATVDGQSAWVTYTRGNKRGLTEHTIAAYRREDGKPISKKTLKEDAQGQLAHGGEPFKILWWRQGYTSAATLEAGEFDKARDMRRPDRFAHFDVWRGTLSNAKEIEDVIGFAKISLLRRQHENEVAFVHLSDDHRQLLLADGLEDHEIKLPKPLQLYDATAFRSQLDEERLFISATIDSVNPTAVEHKKSVPDDLELYQVDRSSREAKPVLRLSGDGRPTGWRVSKKHIAVLRKSKGFDRGGITLEIYAL